MNLTLNSVVVGKGSCSLDLAYHGPRDLLPTASGVGGITRLILLLPLAKKVIFFALKKKTLSLFLRQSHCVSLAVLELIEICLPIPHT